MLQIQTEKELPRALWRMENMKKICLSLISSALIFTGSALHASTVFQENFDATTPQLDVTTAGQFTALNGTNVDLVAASNGWGSLVVAPESGTVVDLGGSGGNPYGQIEAPISVAGGTYVLSFDLVGDQRGGTDTTLVTLGTGSGGTGTLDYNQTFTLTSSQFAGVGGLVTSAPLTIGPGTVYLDFTDVSSPYNIGSLLDNVTLTQTASPVPEPGSLMLLGTGTLGLAFLVYRKARPAAAMALSL